MEVILKFFSEQRMQKYLLPIVTLLFIDAETSQNKIFHIIAHLNIRRKNNLPIKNLLLKAFQSFFCKNPRNFTNYHLISHNTQRPNITFIGVFLFIKDLRSHIGWSPNNCFQETIVLRVFGKSEISNFQIFVFQQNILRFQVSMSNTVFSQLSKTIQNLNQIFHCTFFIKSPLASKSRTKGSSLSQLQDNIKIVGGLVDIIKFDDIHTFQLFVDLDFGIKCILCILILQDFGLIDNFDCYFLLCLFIYSFKYFREGSESKLLTKEYDIFSYSFFRIRLHMKYGYVNYLNKIQWLFINLIKMYYRRWTRMHFKPGMKYFVKYGALDPQFDKYTYLMQMENPDPLQYRAKNPKKQPETDLDTKLINSLFAKYPDLKYEPISKNKYPGQQFNTFSYAYSFINEQKKLLKQGYTFAKSFQLTEAKYHEKMQRKLDQSLLSRGLAFSNRARSFLNVYQQQAQYESRLKTQRTQRQLQKYQLKLKYIRQSVNPQITGSEAFLSDDVLNYERSFYRIKEHNRDIDSNAAMEPVGFTQINKIDGQQRIDFINSVQTKFKNLFSQFYEHAAAKDRLEGLTDSEIINQIQSSPTKIKRQMRQLIHYLESRNIKMSLQNGKVVVTGSNSNILSNQIKNNPYLKIALLSESLNYEKPIYSTLENITKNQDHIQSIFKHKSMLKDVKTEPLTKEQKDLIRQNKKKDIGLVSDEQVYMNKQAYKIFQTQEERLFRLQIKYYEMLISEIESNRKITGEGSAFSEESLKQLKQKRVEAIEDFRRLKYKLQKRYKNISTDQLLYPEHQALEKGVRFEDDVEFEQLIGYMRKKSEQRRLTSLEQSNDNKISQSIRVLDISEGVIPEGKVISKSE